jgi:phage shock protein C
MLVYYVEDGNFLERNLKMDAVKHALRRSRRNRIVAGVCGGLGEFFGISAFWFRLAFFLLILPGGVPGLLVYTIFWVIMPKGN